MTFAARDQAERWWFECQGYVTLPGVMDAAWVAAALACVTRHRDEDGDGAAALGRHSRTLCHRSLPSPTLCRHTLPPLFAATLCQGTLQPTLPSTVVHRGSLCTRCRAGRLTRLKAARMPRRRLLQHGERGPAAPLPRARAAGLLGAAQGHAQRAADDRARGHRGRRALTLPHALVLSEQRSSVSVSHSVLSV